MALGTTAAALATAAATSAATAGGSMLVNRFLSKKGSGSGSGSGETSFTPAGFTGGGLSARFSGGNFNLSSDAGRQDLVSRLAATFPQQAAQIAALRARVAPGVSDLRNVRMNEVENARLASIGNLRENLQRRRVLGSSFGADALARADAEFAQQKERVAAESFMQELELTHNLINEEFQVGRGEFTTNLDELNLQADIASKLAAGATASLERAASVKAELAAREAESAGKFWGQTLQPVYDRFGEAVGSFFNQQSTAPANPWTTTVTPALK